MVGERELGEEEQLRNMKTESQRGNDKSKREEQRCRLMEGMGRF